MGIDSGYGIGSLKPGVCTSTTRPASPYNGQVIYMTDVDQTAVWDGTAWTVLAPIAGGRNVIINGAMNVWQRGTSFTGNYTTDRWLGASNAGSQTWSRSTDVPTGFTYSISQASTTGTNPQIWQTIEAANIKRLVGQIVTVSFYAKSTAGSSQLSLYAAYPTATDNFASQTGDSAASTNFTLTSSWARYSFSYTLSASATTGYKIVLYRNESSASSTTLITGFQLEAGAVATPFEHENAQVTLAKCQRYFEKSYNVDTAPGTASTLGQSIGLGIHTNTPAAYSRFGSGISFKVPKRTTPTVVQYAPASGSSAAASNVTNGDGSTAVGYVSAQQVNQNGFNLAAGIGGTTTTGYFTIFIAYTASAEL